MKKTLIISLIVFVVGLAIAIPIVISCRKSSTGSTPNKSDSKNEQVAKDILCKYNTDIFTAGDLSIIHDIYDECIKRGMKPCKDIGNGPHPADARKRIVNGMKTGYLFKHGWFLNLF